MLKISQVLALLTLLAIPSFAKETRGKLATMAELTPFIQSELALEKTEINTPHGKWIYPGNPSRKLTAKVVNPPLGPELENFAADEQAMLQKWLEQKPTKLVTMITPPEASASLFVKLCRFLHQHGIQYIVLGSSAIPSKKFTKITLLHGGYARIEFQRDHAPPSIAPPRGPHSKKH